MASHWVSMFEHGENDARAAEPSELKAAADRLAEALCDVDEGKLVAEFKRSNRCVRVGRRRLVKVIVLVPRLFYPPNDVK